MQLLVQNYSFTIDAFRFSFHIATGKSDVDFCGRFAGYSILSIVAQQVEGSSTGGLGTGGNSSWPVRF